MDLALILQSLRSLGIESASFNPCFNGSCTYTYLCTLPLLVKFRFNPCFNGSCTYTSDSDVITVTGICFNPCFNGSCTYTVSTPKLLLYSDFRCFLCRNNFCFIICYFVINCRKYLNFSVWLIGSSPYYI